MSWDFIRSAVLPEAVCNFLCLASVFWGHHHFQGLPGL